MSKSKKADSESLLTEELLNQDSLDEPSPVMLDISSDVPVFEETFGLGANKKTLLVTKGISLRNIVKASK